MLALGAEAGVGNGGGQQLALQVEVVAARRAVKKEALGRQGDVELHPVSRQQAPQLLRAVRFQPALRHDGLRHGGQPRGEEPQLAAVHRRAHSDGAPRKIRGLEVDAHAVGESQGGDPQLGQLLAGNHPPRLPELLIGKGFELVLLGGLHLDRLRGGERPAERAFVRSLGNGTAHGELEALALRHIFFQSAAADVGHLHDDGQPRAQRPRILRRGGGNHVVGQGIHQQVGHLITAHAAPCLLRLL